MLSRRTATQWALRVAVPVSPARVTGDTGGQGAGRRRRWGSMLGTRTARLPDCRPLLADPDDLTLVFQPIVDLAGATIAGYEALSRFPGSAGPDVWFAAAAEAGVAAELEALAIHKALAVVPELPSDTFLTLNVSPHLLGTAPVQEALATRGDRHRVVVELTEHTAVHGLDELRRQTDLLRERGALIALDDAGSGY